MTSILPGTRLSHHCGNAFVHKDGGCLLCILKYKMPMFNRELCVEWLRPMKQLFRTKRANRLPNGILKSFHQKYRL